ncbi:MAG: radical SAM protein [Candidatus Omnitrophica bacterium]|nr:radical SAM protein [Candidatus Omnitrophota bacterium]
MLLPLKNLRRFIAKFRKQPFYALNIAAKRIQALTAYYFRRGKSAQPESITLFLTEKCNLRCKMCGQWGESGVTKNKAACDVKEELAFDKMQNLIDQVSTFSPSITLFGGEPLLYPKCIELIKYIKIKKMHVLMITNAALIKGRAGGIIEAGLDELNVSLDGPGELHDQIRGMPGLFVRIRDSLKEIQDYKKAKNLKFPLINLQCTITKYNYLQLERMLDVARDIGADSLTYHNLIFLNQDLIEKQKVFDQQLECSSENWQGFVFAPEIDPEKLYAKMQSILKQQLSFSVDFYPNLSKNGLNEYYNNPSYLPKEYPKRCLSPWVCVYVFPDGNVRPCLNSTYTFGNIKNNEFKQIWNSKQAVNYRQMLKNNKIFSTCIRCTELYRY